MLLQLSSAALDEALAPLSKLIGGLAGDLLGSLGGVIGGASAGPANGGAGPTQAQVRRDRRWGARDGGVQRVDAGRGELPAIRGADRGMLARAVGRGRRGL